MILDKNDHRFTFSEMVGENRLEVMSVRNWIQREVVTIGYKHKLGRWLFSVSDRLLVRAMQNVLRLTAMSPGDAAVFAKIYVERFHELVTPDAFGKYPLLSLLERGSKRGRLRLYLVPGMEGPIPIKATHLEDGRLTGYHKLGTHKYEIEAAEEKLRNIENIEHSMFPVDETIGYLYMRCVDDIYNEDGDDMPMLNIGNPEPGEDADMVHFTAQISLDGMIAWYEKFGNDPATNLKAQRDAAAINETVDQVAKALGDG